MKTSNSGFANLFPLSARIAIKSNAGDSLAETASIIKAANWPVTTANLLPWAEAVEGHDLQISIIIEPCTGASSTPSARETGARPPPDGHLMAQTLRNMLKGEDVVDTKFVLYSQRLAPSDSRDEYGATKPRAVFANSGLLASVSEYFQTCEQK